MFSKIVFLFRLHHSFFCLTQMMTLHLDSLLVSGCQSPAQTLIHNAHKKKNHYSILWNSPNVTGEVMIYFRLFSKPDTSPETDLWFSICISSFSLPTLILGKFKFIFVEKEMSQKFDDKC